MSGQKDNSKDAVYDGHEVTYVYPKRILKATILGGIPLVCFAILVIEMCERFGYYTNVSVNALYVKNIWGFSQDQWFVITTLFNFWVYLTPLIGGFVADAFWGKKTTIVVFGLMYLIGMTLQFIGSLPFTWADFPNNPGNSEYITYASLAIIGLAAGSIKANVGPLMGEQLVRVTNDELNQKAWSYFYWAINLGGLLAFIIGPLTHQYGETKIVSGQPEGTSFYYSYAVGMGVIFCGLTIFFCFLPFYISSKPTGSAFGMFTKAIWRAFRNRNNGKTVNHWIERADGFSPKVLNDYKSVVALFPILLFYPVFFIGYNNVLGLAPTQASVLDHPSWVTADVLGALDSLAIIIFIPIFDMIVYPLLRKYNREPSIVLKISLGFFFMGCASAYIAFIQYWLMNNGTLSEDGTTWYPSAGNKRPSFLMAAPSYLLMGLGEIFGAVTLNELCYSQAPISMKSIVFSLGLITSAVSSAINMPMAPLLETKERQLWYFVGSFALMTLFAIFFYIIFRKQVFRSVSEDRKAAEEQLENECEVNSPGLVNGDRFVEEGKKPSRN
eukprot:Nk52_evm7s282 gene=Nk52_evmTU7s282